ncbi:MAG TPA: hypothetical protein VFW93_16660 [Aquabacterium sp.]|uniref:hypothetical protein n=1 Tax=Aquabacterium sp. TaxID=1872578 RepID=UPI002E306C83|nr:hypothetical protein [Aquabacterium sp.]HEX5357837.1 hypothetical protein [Aquabacterium sp.]
MITYENPKLWQRTWVLAMVLGGGVGVAAWWWQTHAAQQAEAAPEAAPAVSAKTGAQKAVATVDSALLVQPRIMEDGRPSDFTPEDWSALKEAMSKTANPRSELERVVKYLRFQKGFEQWQSLQDSPDVTTRHQLARRLLEQIPDRLKQAELTMGEALMLEAALWTDLEPNEELRKQKLEQAQSALTSAAPQPDAEQQARDASLLKEYKRREAAILADFQAKPEGQRDQAKLEQALEAARVSVYGRKN